MTEAYTRKIILLEKILQDGIQKLLNEAKDKGFIKPPYGRLPNPTPLITEEEFLAAGGIDCDDEEPEFKFEYGFDPLRVLADYIMWAHPESVEKRIQDKVDAAKYLTYRAQYARHQLSVAKKLVNICKEQRSGILWGPFSSPLSSTSIVCVSKPLKKGTVIFQLSTNKDFSPKEEVKTIECSIQSLFPEVKQHLLQENHDSGGLDSDVEPLICLAPVKVVFNDLKAGTKYFVRCCLSDNVCGTIQSTENKDPENDAEQSEEDLLDSAFPGLVGNVFKESAAWTLPSEEAVQPEVVETAPVTQTSRRSTSRRESKLSRSASPVVPPVGIAAPPHHQAVKFHCFGQLPVEQFSSFSSSMQSDSQDDSQGNPVTAMKNLNLSATTATAAATPHLSFVLGDLFNHSAIRESVHSHHRISYSDSPLYADHLTNLFTRCELFLNENSPLRNSSVVFGWRDGSSGSSNALRLEEIAHKQFRHDFKKYQKKYGQNSDGKSGRNSKSERSGSASGSHSTAHIPPPPTLHRPLMRDSVQTIFQTLPIELDILPSMAAERLKEREATAAAKTNTSGVSPRGSGTNSPRRSGSLSPRSRLNNKAVSIDHLNACRMMYRSFMVGAEVEVIVLDMRGSTDRGGDYLGKEQAGWLTHTLKNSTAQWKVILCGRTTGAMMIHPKTNAHVTSSAMVGSSESKTNVEKQHDDAAQPAQKQVQLKEPDKAQAAAADEQLEEIYGRSMSSLQHILAQHQETAHLPRSPYQVKLDDSNPPAPIDPATSPIHLTSGIVVVSSGLTRSGVSLCVLNHDNHYNHGTEDSKEDHPEDEVCPAFIAAYTNLSALPLEKIDEEQARIDAQRVPAQSELKASSFLDVYCAEVALGRLGTNDTGKDSVCCYRNGFAAHTAYSAVPSKNETEPESGTNMLKSMAYCQIEVLPQSGDLRVRMFDTKAALDRQLQQEPIAECLFAAPSILNSSDKDSDAPPI